MSDHDDVEEFETADAGASTTVPMQAGSVRKGGFMVIKGRPTKVRPSRDAAVFFPVFRAVKKPGTGRLDTSARHASSSVRVFRTMYA